MGPNNEDIGMMDGDCSVWEKFLQIFGGLLGGSIDLLDSVLCTTPVGSRNEGDGGVGL